jgi:hypothetical protein
MFIPTPSTLKRLVRICTLTGHLADIGRRPPLTQCGNERLLDHLVGAGKDRKEIMRPIAFAFLSLTTRSNVSRWSTIQITGHRRPRRRRLRRGHRRRPSPNPFVQPFNGDRPEHMQIRPTRWRIRGP